MKSIDILFDPQHSNMLRGVVDSETGERIIDNIDEVSNREDGLHALRIPLAVFSDDLMDRDRVAIIAMKELIRRAPHITTAMRKKKGFPDKGFPETTAQRSFAIADAMIAASKTRTE